MGLIGTTLQNVIDWGTRKGYFVGPGGTFVSYGPDAEFSPYNQDQLQASYGRNPWVNVCVRRTSDMIAGLPWRVYHETGEGENTKRTQVFSGPLVDLLARPNPMHTAHNMRRHLSASYTLNGEAFLYIDDGTKGRGPSGVTAPFQMRTLNPKHIAPIKDPIEFLKGWRYQISGKTYDMQPEYITPMLSWDPSTDYRGLPPSKVAADSVMLEQFMMDYNQLFFKQGGSLGDVFSTDARLRPEAKKQLAEHWQKQHGGSAKHHKAAFLDGGLKPVKLGQTARDGQFMELSRLSREEVLAIFMLPPVLAGIFEYANYANTKEQLRIFYDVTIRPICTMIEDSLNNRMIPNFFKVNQGRLLVLFDYSDIDILKEDQKAAAETRSIDTSSGVRTINEVRAGLNLKPVPWGNNPPPAVTGFGGLALSGHRMTGGFPGADKASRPPKHYIPGIDVFKGTDEEFRIAAWKAFDERAKRDEARYEAAMVKYFDDQEDRLIAAVEETYGKTAGRGKGPQWIKKAVQDDLFGAFNIEEEAKLLADFVQPLNESIAEAVGGDTLEQLGMDGNIFNVHDPKMKLFLEKKRMKFGRDITAATKDIIRGIIGDALQDDATVQQTAKLLKDQFSQFKTIRSVTIARTEIIGIHNGTAIEGFDQSGIVESKQWLTSRDDRVRDEHLMMEGVTVSLRSDFPSGLQAPGVGGVVDDPAEIVNCRCTVLPVVSRER